MMSMSRDNHDKALRIAVRGLDEKDQTLLNMVFGRGLGKGQGQLVAEDAAEVEIIDMDKVSAREFRSYRERFPNRPTIVLSLQPVNVEGMIHVSKPVQIAALLEALHKIRQGLAPATHENLHKTEPSHHSTHQVAAVFAESDLHEVCGHRPDIEPFDSMGLKTVFYDNRSHLHHLIKTALTNVQTGQTIKIERDTLRLFILPEQRKILNTLDDLHLYPFCVVPWHRYAVHVSFLDPQQTFLTMSRGTETLQSLDTFLWKITLWASRGRVPNSTDLHAPVKLRHWPNMTRLHRFPHALRIAALWNEHPHSLLETAKLLHIPQRYVFSFYTAAESLNLIEVVEKPMVKTTARQTKNAQPRGFLQRFLRRLLHKQNDGND